jgi:hypothetical protein
MATAKRSTLGQGRSRRRIWLRVLLAVVVLAGPAGWYWRAPIAVYTQVGAAFGARTACSCRYVAGRPIGDCKKDFEPGMALVMLSDDRETRSVTARVPLLSSATARYREGYGCLLEPWDG